MKDSSRHKAESAKILHPETAGPSEGGKGMKQTITAILIPVEYILYYLSAPSACIHRMHSLSSHYSDRTLFPYLLSPQEFWGLQERLSKVTAISQKMSLQEALSLDEGQLITWLIVITPLQCRVDRPR